MPTYEYECGKCGHRFERFQKMTDKPVKRCPVCRGGVRRLFGAGAGVLFKGSGFYATDYRSGDYGKARKSEAGAQAADAAKDSGSAKKTDKDASKPAKTE